MVGLTIKIQHKSIALYVLDLIVLAIFCRKDLWLAGILKVKGFGFIVRHRGYLGLLNRLLEQDILYSTIEIPSWELTYSLPRHFWRPFFFSQGVLYVSSPFGHFKRSQVIGSSVVPGVIFQKTLQSAHRNQSGKVSSTLGNEDLIRMSRFATYQLPRWDGLIFWGDLWYPFSEWEKKNQPEFLLPDFSLGNFLVTMINPTQGFRFPRSLQQIAKSKQVQWTWEMREPLLFGEQFHFGPIFRLTKWLCHFQGLPGNHLPEVVLAGPGLHRDLGEQEHGSCSGDDWLGPGVGSGEKVQVL